MENLKLLSDIELLKKTREYLYDTQDEGPCGEGWKSDKLRALIEEIESRVE